ncbi:uncharacterized protein LOC111099615 isoform X3 [Crassostrea virginica]
MPESDADPCTSHAQEDLSTFAEPQIISIKENTASDYATTTATVELPENLREKGTEIRNQKKTGLNSFINIPICQNILITESIIHPLSSVQSNVVQHSACNNYFCHTIRFTLNKILLINIEKLSNKFSTRYLN